MQGFGHTRRVRVHAACTSALVLALAGAGCAMGGPSAGLRPTPVPVTPGPALPPVPPVDGPLQLTVVYPPDNAVLAVRDSNFVFGGTGSGRTSLRINGTAVPVAPDGAFLAWLPVPADGVYSFQATKGAESLQLERRVQVTPRPDPPAGAAILPGSPYPTGALALPYGEAFEVGFTGASGGEAWVILPGGEPPVRLSEKPLVDRGSTEAANFRGAPQPAERLAGWSRYAGMITVQGPWVGPDTSARRPALEAAPPRDLVPVSEFVRDTTMERQARIAGRPLPSAQDRAALERLGRRMQITADSLNSLTARYAGLRPLWAQLELIVGSDTTRLPLALQLAGLPASTPRVGVITPPAGAPADWTTHARPGLAGPYHWFWPPGTQVALDAERGGQYRVRLTRGLSAWLPASDITLLPANSPPPQGVVSGVRLAARSEGVDVRIPLPARMPFRVDEAERTLDITVYGATSEVNFLQYGALDSLVERAEWSQPADREFRVRVTLTQPVWGYQAFFDESGALVVRIRRPPPIDATHPLQGLLIAVDPGHPPAGANGPTGLTEAEANLAVALALKPMLESRGARVLLTRVDASPVALDARPRLATDMNADILLSLHNNAFPDGVNPFTSAGTSVYYFQPQSLELARAVLDELENELRLRDIGIGRADLAVVRATWMPAVLSETMFLMIPEQEAALRNPDVQQRIAAAHVRALETFLRSRARSAR